MGERMIGLAHPATVLLRVKSSGEVTAHIVHAALMSGKLASKSGVAWVTC